MVHLQNLACADLLKLIEIHGKSWLAHDGCWFLAAEERHGFDDAIALDIRACELSSPAEDHNGLKGRRPLFGLWARQH